MLQLKFWTEKKSFFLPINLLWCNRKHSIFWSKHFIQAARTSSPLQKLINLFQSFLLFVVVVIKGGEGGTVIVTTLALLPTIVKLLSIFLLDHFFVLRNRID